MIKRVLYRPQHADNGRSSLHSRAFAYFARAFERGNLDAGLPGCSAEVVAAEDPSTGLV